MVCRLVLNFLAMAKTTGGTLHKISLQTERASLTNIVHVPLQQLRLTRFELVSIGVARLDNIKVLSNVIRSHGISIDS